MSAVEAIDYHKEIKDALMRPAPQGWKPKPGERVFLLRKKSTAYVTTGVVLDDPIVRRLRNLDKNGRYVLTKGKRTRLAFFYRVVVNGIGVGLGDGRNRVFYVELALLRPAPQQISRKHLLKLALDSLYSDCVM